MSTLPVFYSAHHTSSSYGKYKARCALTREQQIQFSDLGTGTTVPKHTGLFLKSNYSRGVVDLNRDKNDLPSLFHEFDFGRFVQHKVWKSGEEPTKEERKRIVETIYDPYHKSILTTIQKFKRPGVVVAWDNTASYESEYEYMRPFVLSNNGDRESGDAVNKKSVLTCDPRFLEEFAAELRLALKKQGLIDEVHLNIYNPHETNNECAYIANHYNTFREGNNLDVSNVLHSFQFEYDTDVIENTKTLKPHEGKREKLKAAFEEAMEKAYSNLLSWNVGVSL